MTIALLLALGVAGAGMWVSRRWRLAGQTMMVLGAVGLIAVLAVQVRQDLIPAEPKPPNGCEMAVSACLANFIPR